MNLSKQSSWVRIPLFFGILLAVWLPIALPLYLVGGEGAGLPLAIILYLLFVVQIGWWGRKLGHTHPYRYYGLTISAQSVWELLLGLSIALGSFAIQMGLMVWFGWLVVQRVAWWQAIGSGALTALGVAFAEELLFRGWLLTELEENGKTPALWLSSFIFALLHFIKPIEVILQTWMQVFGLVLLGMILVWGRWGWGGRLAMAIGLHSGLVWGFYVVNTTHWLVPSGAVPAWVTGIGGNPLAGLFGLGGLGVMGIIIKKKLIWGMV